MSADDLIKMATKNHVTLSDQDREVLLRFVDGAEGRFDLETLLADLSTAVRFSKSRYAKQDFTDSRQTELKSLLAKVNKTLSMACDLANDASKENEDLRAHRTFFSRVVASRRGDLPRLRVYTTNYDLVIEKSLDNLGLDYIDGFIGTVNRTLRMDVYSREYYTTIPPTNDRRPRRLADFLYFYKIHGSLNWRSRTDHSRTMVDRVLQIPNYSTTPYDDLSLIYPTPQKEADTLGYPYSDLLRAFGGTLSEPDTALLTFGYGFSDEHINRIIAQSLASNSTLAIIIVDPYLLQTDGDEDTLVDTPIARFAGIDDARVAAITGEDCTFVRFADTFLPAVSPEDEAAEKASAENAAD
ncbi:MAG TPA: SIR2 family protein [Candidatus Elarobacter sp.]|jgi:hypothetical protein|nr:SIR2 family protein [Candidatus Elarobacter sp.]